DRRGIRKFLGAYVGDGLIFRQCPMRTFDGVVNVFYHRISFFPRARIYIGYISFIFTYVLKTLELFAWTQAVRVIIGVYTVQPVPGYVAGPPHADPVRLELLAPALAWTRIFAFTPIITAMPRRGAVGVRIQDAVTAVIT